MFHAVWCLLSLFFFPLLLTDKGVYWPDSASKAIQVASFKVALSKRQQKPGFVIRKFEMSSLDESNPQRPRSVYHFQIEAWPEEGPHISTLNSMIQEVLHTKAKPTEPLVVHDIDGGSAAGVFVAAMNGMAMIKEVRRAIPAMLCCARVRAFLSTRMQTGANQCAQIIVC